MTEREEVIRERKLVRARPKTLDYLPDWAKCCDWRIALLGGMDQTEYAISGTRAREPNRRRCQNCDFPQPAGIDAILDDGDKFAMELLDLDEGVLADD